MVKKKSIIFSVILLLTVYLGLSGTCYAFSLNSYNDFVNWVDEVSDEALDYYINQASTGFIQSAKAVAECSDFQSLNVNWGNYNNYFFRHFVSASDSTAKGWILYCFNTNTDLIVDRDGRIYLYGNSTSTCDAYYFRYISHGGGEYTCWYYYTSTVTYNNTTPPFQINYDNNMTFIGSDNNITNNSEYPVFGPIAQPFFGFEEVSTTQHVKIGSDGVSMPLYYAPGSTLYVANLINNDGRDELDLNNVLLGDELYIRYYNGSNWGGSIRMFKRDFDDNNYFRTNRYMRFSDNLFYDIDISLLSPYLYTNVVYDYKVFYRLRTDSLDMTPRFITYYCYIGDTNTVTDTNSVIDVTNSIPDMPEYIRQFNGLPGIINDNENTDDIIDNINSGDNNIIGSLTDDSQVNGMIADFTSGDVFDMANRLGMMNLGNPYSIFIYGFIDKVGQVIQSSGDVTFDYSMHGEPGYTIHSDDIYLPNGVLKTFISCFMIFLTIYIVFNRFKILIDGLSIVDVQSTLNDVDIDTNFFYM